MPAPFIRITGLCKRFVMGRETVTALDGVDVGVEANTFSAVIGPSGSGKSTLMYLLGGLDRPTTGQLEVNGQALEALDENALAVYRRRMVGFIFQSFNLIPSMTALENVAFPMRFARTSQRARNTRALDLLKQVGLENRAYHRPTELSGGQQQRVAMARALVAEPAIVLADEPTGNLDTHSADEIAALLRQVADEWGRAVLMVTHDPRIAAYADRIIFLKDGTVVDETKLEGQSVA